MRDVIRVMDVSKSFGEETVLHHISYDFKEGRIYGIVGNNGSGKTVLMKCICGFLIPDSGEITVNYKRIGKDMDFPQDTGIIIETPGFLPNLTGMRNLELLASLRKKIDKKAVAEAIRAVGLDPEMKKPVSKYSLGMRQRLGIAQAIMEDPDILLLDEPFGALDAVTRARLQDLVRELWTRDEKKKTVFFVTHDVDEALLLANRILVLGQSPSHIIYDVKITEELHPTRDTLFENIDMMKLRITLINQINKDVTTHI